MFQIIYPNSEAWIEQIIMEKYPIHHVNLLWSSGAIKTTETKDYSEPIKDKVGNLIPQGVFPKSNLLNINIWLLM